MIVTQFYPLSAAIHRARQALAGTLVLGSAAAAAGPAPAQTPDAGCYPTAGGALEICRGGEAEGVLFVPRPCESASGVQIFRPAEGGNRLQVVYQAETPARARRGESCAPRRAVTPLDGGAVRSGSMPEQLATTMPPTQARLWELARVAQPEGRSRRGRRARAPEASETVPEGIAARHPMVVAGRDWSGDVYSYVFLLTTVPGPSGNRHALMQARTADFERFDIRGADADGAAWVPFTPEAGGRRRSRRGGNPAPSPVLDETGGAVVGNCPGTGFDRNDLVGSISVVDQVYHYFYTDVLPTDCAAPPAQRRLGLYLRTSRDLAADRPWSSARLVAEPLPGEALVRVAKAKGMDRWVVAYTCNRPSNTMDGPVADLCVQYTADLALGSIAGLAWYSEPTAIMRSPAYLGLRSGGDGTGRFGRAQHFWMTDRYGNLATPTSYPGKAGFLTWLDRRAPGSDGPGPSSVFGRPIYWGTWSVRPLEAR